MGTVQSIDFPTYAKQHNLVLVDLVEKGLFTEEDFLVLQELFGYLDGKKKLHNVLSNIPYVIKNLPVFVQDFDQIILNRLKDLKKFSADKSKPLREKYPITDYIHKASIAAAAHPQNVLEIGTYYGWGAASIKAACPDAAVYTMNPKENKDANNPIDEELIGSVCRKKGLEVVQLWADSTQFDFSTLPRMDVTYVDGNHSYDYVYKDLENVSKITNKMLLLDDYIPDKNSPRGDVRAWGPWNAEVVKAVNDFVASHSAIIESAYWIIGTPICVIHLKKITPQNGAR
ncbi:MAG: class I SAM-dependent methyltransferase [bacterium]